MSRAALVLRPEPGASDTARRLRAIGVPVRCCPLFAVSPVAWRVPDAGAYDALLLTSANAIRHADLSGLAALPVLAVGEATAAAARRAGLRVVLTGNGGAAELVEAARTRGFARPLHLAGRDRIVLPGVDQIAVYASEPVEAEGIREWAGQIALLHSARAARRFAELATRHRIDRATIDIVALSAAVADAAGGGWTSVTVASQPDDAAMAAATRALIDRPAPGADK